MYDTRLLSLEKHGMKKELIRKFDYWIATRNPIEIKKLTPIEFSRETGLDVRDCFKLFHYATVEDILDAKFEVICPSCLRRIGLYKGFGEIKEVESCKSCNKSFHQDRFKDSSKVWFSLKQIEIQRIDLTKIDQLLFQDEVVHLLEEHRNHKL